MKTPSAATVVDGKARARIAVIGSGPGGAVTATLLAEAGHDVLMIEEGPHARIGSTPHFTRQEMTEKYRSGGVTVGLGRTNVTYVEGRCVGGGSEVNRGLYHRLPPEVMAQWADAYSVEAFTPDVLTPCFDACEEIARISYLPGEAPPLSRKLHQGASALGWASMEVPRLVRYDQSETGPSGRKQSMSETFVPRFEAAGGRLMAGIRARRLRRSAGAWRLQAERAANNGRETIEIEADTVFMACGAIHTPALMRRSGWTGNAGDGLRFHPMVKAIARFEDVVNPLGTVDPVHQIKEFDPRFSLGCSVSPRPALALTMIDHPDRLPDVDRDWRHMGIYYAQTTGGRGTVRVLPGYRDPLVRVRFTTQELCDLADGFRRLCECLFAAGATEIFPAITGIPILHSPDDLALIPDTLDETAAGLSTLHMFSTCPMGEDERRCVTDSFGRVYGQDKLYIADASLLCGPTVVNPQGSVMAVAHRNATEFLN